MRSCMISSDRYGIVIDISNDLTLSAIMAIKIRYNICGIKIKYKPCHTFAPTNFCEEILSIDFEDITIKNCLKIYIRQPCAASNSLRDHLVNIDLAKVVDNAVQINVCYNRCNTGNLIIKQIALYPFPAVFAFAAR